VAGPATFEADNGLITSITGDSVQTPFVGFTSFSQTAPNNRQYYPYTTTERTKLAGIAANATANATDAALRDRSTHTGTQSAGTITGLGGAATLNVGTAAGTVSAGDHAHGNLTTSGAIGTTADRIAVTTTSGVLTTAAIGYGLTLFGGTLTASGDSLRSNIKVT
jgi:hypothetical protein